MQSYELPQTRTEKGFYLFDGGPEKVNYPPQDLPDLLSRSFTTGVAEVPSPRLHEFDLLRHLHAGDLDAPHLHFGRLDLRHLNLGHLHLQPIRRPDALGLG